MIELSAFTSIDDQFYVEDMCKRIVFTSQTSRGIFSLNRLLLKENICSLQFINNNKFNRSLSHGL